MINHDQARMMTGGRKKDGANLSFISRDGLRGDDYYPTPPAATRALLSVESFTGPIWEPACGGGAISEVLKAAGHTVISTDLVERKYGAGRIDFLMETKPLAPNIITNPPYKNAQDFAEKAVSLTTGKVAFLMRLVWLEGSKRRKFFESSRLSRVWVFSKRLPRMHRPDYSGPKTTSTIAFAWFVWEHGYIGDPTLGWVNPI